MMRALVISAILAIAAAPSWAQQWKAEWDRLVAAAKADGAITIAQSGNPGRRQWLMERWRRDFPDIKLDINMIVSGQLVQRATVERQGGKYLWDVSMTGATGLYGFVKQGGFDPLRDEFVLPEVNDAAAWGGWDNAFYDHDKKYVMAVLNDFSPLYYNAKLVPPADVARLSTRVLLEPGYKGKILWQDPRIDGPGASLGVMLYKVLGEPGFRRLVVDQAPVFYRPGNDIVDAFVRGRGTFFLGPSLIDRLKPYRDAGVEFDARPFGNRPEHGFVGTDGIALAVFNKRPHPNATRVFVNWLLTKEVSYELGQAQGMNSRRNDVRPISPPELTTVPGLAYINPQGEDASADMAKVQALARELQPN
jgi:iron(III) transport system substrate-binding protein